MLWKCCGYIISHSKFQMQTTFVVVYLSSSKGIFCEVLWNFVGRPVVEDKFFTPHGFISLATRTTLTLSWILGKPLLKPKRAHIYTKRRRNPWFKLIAHHFIFGSRSKLMTLIGGILGVVVWRAKKYVQ